MENVRPAPFPSSLNPSPRKDTLESVLPAPNPAPATKDMSLKLSPQLDADPIAAFALYTAYFNANKRSFPKSIIPLIDHDQWNGGCMSDSPHDSLLTEIKLDALGSKDAEITIHLSKPHLDLEIIITYKGVLKFDFPEVFRIDEPLEWRYEQFLYFDPYKDFGIKNRKMFQHDIEWRTGDIWSIIASEIKVSWSKRGVT